MLRVILLALTLTLTSCNLPTDGVGHGMRAYQHGAYDLAEKLFRSAAERGDVRGQNALGAMYNDGKGVPQDSAEAVKWFRMAAEQGDAAGQHNLGVMYLAGRGVPEDSAEAVKWFRMAAEQGYATAQNDLGVMYKFGEGVPQDDVLAYMWFNLAVAHGLGDAGKNRDNVAKRMTSEQIAETHRMVRDWKPK